MFEKIKNSYMKMYNSKLKKMKGKKTKKDYSLLVPYN